jgi:hypothetical protein
VLGILLGFWLGGFVTLQVEPDMRFVGIPFPGVALHLEKGHWVDYVGFIPVILPCNAFIWTSLCLMPISVGLVIRRWFSATEKQFPQPSIHDK